MKHFLASKVIGRQQEGFRIKKIYSHHLNRFNCTFLLFSIRKNSKSYVFLYLESSMKSFLALVRPALENRAEIALSMGKVMPLTVVTLKKKP